MEEIEKLADKNPEIKKAYNSLKALSADEAMRHAAHQREMAINDEKYEQGKAEGIEQGRAEGIKRGIDKGKLREKAWIAKNALSKGLDIGTISAITGLTTEEIGKLK